MSEPCSDWRAIALTRTTLNPYRPPDADCEWSSIAWANTHQWCGHSIRVASHASPKTLWLINSLIVSVDDAAPLTAIFPVGQTMHFSFQHEGQGIRGTVKREQCLNGGRVVYSLAIEDKFVDKATISAGAWRHVMLVLVGPFALAGIPLTFLLEVPWCVVVVCAVGSMLWSIATIRLVARDQAIDLPVRKHHGG